MVRFITLILLSCLSIIFISKTFLKEPLIKKEVKAVNPRYEPLPELFNSSDTLNVYLHYKNITKHIKKPFFQNLPTGLAYRNDEVVERYYNYFYARHDNPKIADLGYLMLAILELRNNRGNFASENLSKISDKSIPYYLQEKAYLDYTYDNFTEAEKGFREAIIKNPDSEFAHQGLIKTLYKTRNYSGLVDYLSDKTIQYYPKYILSEVYFYSGRLIDYYSLTLNIFESSWVEALAALLVTIVWLVYLFKINVFSPISWNICVITFLLSLLFIVLCDIPYEFFHVFFDFRLRQSIGNDFLYSIFGIGLIEEITKIIPVIIVLYIFRKKISEPYHYLLIASISALGFAFLENIMYFKLYPGNIIYIRAMISVTIHLFCTVLITYGAMVISSQKYKVDYKYGALFFLVSIFFHGLFDITLINDDLTVFSYFSYGFMIMAIYGLCRMFNYALNISPNYFDLNDFNSKKLHNYLILAFTGIFLFNFILGSIFNGYHASYDLLVDGLIGFIILLAYLASGLSDLSLIYGFRTGITEYIKKFNYNDLLHSKIQITLLNNNKLTTITHGLFTNHRVSIKDKANFILSSTEENNPYQGFTNLILAPYQYTENKKRVYYTCKLYGIESDLNNFYTETPTLKLLGSVEVVIPGKEKPPARSIFERINAGVFFFIGVIIIFTFIYYMNYKSARQAYRWAFDYLENKSLYKAGQNMEYAMRKDDTYSEAYLLAAKISFCINDYNACIKYCESVIPNNHAQETELNYMIARCNFEMKRYSDAEKYFNKLDNITEVRDSVLFYKSKLLILDNKYADAYKILETTFPITTDDSINFMKIKYLVQTEKYSNADSILTNDLVKCGSNLPAYYYWKANVALGMSDTSSACKYFTESDKLKYAPAQVQWGIHCYARYESKMDSTAVIETNNGTRKE
jgi:RsiW-degrading membrane proteinase PrsW (M82 family)